MTRTPGDWEFGPFAQGFIVVERPEDGRDLYLAEIVDEDDEGLFEPDEEKRLANGRLMAAAPDLLAACEVLVTLWDSPEPFTGADALQAIGEATERARAALRKALNG